jgi:para-nitrobenzyl esterase
MTSESNAGPAASRRAFLQGGAVAAAAATAALAQQRPAEAQARDPAAGLGATSNSKIFFVADTANGKVEGVVNDGIIAFKGVPYGAPTGGASRFMPPKAPEPWTGVREALGYAQISPQTPADLSSEYAQMIMWDRHVGDGGMGEDMLNLNVWTPGLDGAKRPVLVSFHGGGWATGSGNGPMYDGANLAKFGDVVVVTVNHRLAALGYLDLASLGAPSEFAYAGVAGVMDMVAALKWVRDNIDRFGGDPNRVMVFGQSGGGSKTSTLLATPSAKGLFHRAAVQSGSTLKFQGRDQSQRAAEMLLAGLGISKANIGDIQKVSWRQILEAQTAAVGVNFTPIADGTVLPHDPSDPGAPPESATVPVIISTTLEDAALRLTNFDLDEAGLHAVVDKAFPGRADAIISLYRAAEPAKRPYLIQAQILTDAGGRRNAIVQAEHRAALGPAPTYMYMWSWATPAYDGKFGAVHGHDVDASFHIARSPIVGSGRAAGKLMADRLAGAWVAFARTGQPSHEGIPAWPAYDATTRATMIFNDDTRVENDPRAAMRKFWA